MKRQHFLLLPLTLALTQVWAADEPVEQDSALAPVVVTGTQQQKANTVKFNKEYDGIFIGSFVWAILLFWLSVAKILSLLRLSAIIPCE